MGEVKEALKKSVLEQILLSLSQKTPAVSLAHHQDSTNKMLNYIYNSIGFKYDLVKSRDTVKTQLTKKELIKKDKLNKFVKIKFKKKQLQKIRNMKEELLIKEKFRHQIIMQIVL